MAGLSALAAIAGSRERPTSAADTRPSTFLPGPNGAQALAESLEQLGIGVTRVRRHQPRALAEQDSGGLFAILDPTFPVTAAQATDLIALPHDGVSLLVAGSGASRLLACLGFRTAKLQREAPVAPLDPAGAAAPTVQNGLERTRDSIVVDSTGLFDSSVIECHVPRYQTVDTLLTALGQPEAIRLVPEGATGAVILVGDVALFRNRVLRDTDAGPIVLGWIAGRYRQVWFDEYHHGFLSGGSLAAWTLRWSRQSPWGWPAWHLAIVGLIALGAAAIRFGPPRPAIERRRRSVTEHVRALALALRASGGHGLAVGIIIDGLRRRLAAAVPGRRTSRGEWLDEIGAGSANPRVREISGKLKLLDRATASEGAVLSAVNLVEDLWSEMRS